jgi:hypothetical protein
MPATNVDIPTTVSAPARRLKARLLTRLLTLNTLSGAPGRIRIAGGVDWWELRGRNSRSYRIREWLCDLTADAAHFKAVRQTVKIEARRARRRADRATDPRQRIALGGVCPGCHRAHLDGGVCTGRIFRRHPPARRRAGLITYWS